MVDYRDEKHDDERQYHGDKGIERPGDLDDIGAAQPKLTVHYPDHVHEGSTPGYVNQIPVLESRASSIMGTDDERDEEDEEHYDWSAEEDLEDQHAEYEKQMGIKSKPKGWGIKKYEILIHVIFRPLLKSPISRIATLLFSSMIGSTFLAALLVAPAVLVYFFWYKKNPTDQRRFVTDNVEAWLFWAASNILISWYLAMIVDIVPVIVWYIISLAWGHVSEYVKGRIELYDSVKDNIKPLLYAGSGWLSWIIIFENIFNLHTSGDINSPAPYTNRVGSHIIRRS
jgi:hypothetical protein